VAERSDAEGESQILSYLVGTMIEVPRGALTAAEIAKTAEFFSFGTNDLTQTTLGVQPRTMPARFPGSLCSMEIYARTRRSVGPRWRGSVDEDRPLLKADPLAPKLKSGHLR